MVVKKTKFNKGWIASTREHYNLYKTKKEAETFKRRMEKLYPKRKIKINKVFLSY